MKQLDILDTSTWLVKCESLEEPLDRLNLNEVDAEELELTIDFQNLETFLLNLLNTEYEQFFIVPDLPCATWSKTLHDQVTAEAVKMPNEPDTFVDDKGNPLGNLAWDNWLFYRPAQA